MATVTGFTSTRMAAIEASSVVSGAIDGSNHLILTTHGGGTIDAGLIATSDMSLSGVQTVTGAKTYNAGTLLDKGSRVFNVKAFGAVGNGTTDDTAALQAAVDAAQAAGGGEVWLGSSTYKLAVSPLKLYSGSGSALVGYSNIKIVGAGATLAQSTTAIDVVKCLNDVTYSAAKSVGNSIENVKLSFTGTATNSGNGVYLAQQAVSGAIYEQWSFKNVTVINCQGSGKYAFNVEGIQEATFERCTAKDCSNGFNANGNAGSAFGSSCNTSSFQNCYVNASSNAVNGFRVGDSANLTFTGCKVTYSANSSGVAYLVEGSSTLKFNSCGFELSGGATLTAGFKITENAGAAGSHQVMLDACRSYQSKSTKEIWVTNSSDAIVQAYRGDASVSGSTGLTLDGNAWVVDVQSTYSAATNRTLSTTARWLTPGTVRVGFVTGNNTPAPIASQSDMYFMTGFTGAVTVGAPTGNVDDAQLLELQYLDTAAHGITHNAIFRAGPAAMLTTTVANKVVTETYQYSTGAVKWTCIRSYATGW